MFPIKSYATKGIFTIFLTISLPYFIHQSGIFFKNRCLDLPGISNCACSVSWYWRNQGEYSFRFPGSFAPLGFISAYMFATTVVKSWKDKTAERKGKHYNEKEWMLIIWQHKLNTFVHTLLHHVCCICLLHHPRWTG